MDWLIALLFLATGIAIAILGAVPYGTPARRNLLAIILGAGVAVAALVLLLLTVT